MTYELNARLTYTILVPKRNHGFGGGLITKHTKGITLITVTSYTSTQTVSRTDARGSSFVRTLTKVFMQDFLEDGLAGNVQQYGHKTGPDLTTLDLLFWGLVKNYIYIVKFSKSVPFERKNRRSPSACMKRYSTACMVWK
jgi:hypothetical protein